MNSADTADQMMKMTLEGIEVAAEIGMKAGGTAAKSIAVTLYAILTDNRKIKGKTRLDTMLKSGKELKVFAIHHADLAKFCTEAKHYGVLYSVLKEKGNTDGIVDIMVRAEDASKISRMVDKFDLATIDAKAIRESVLSQQKNLPSPSLTETEQDHLIQKMMGEKERNPVSSRMEKNATPFEESSKTLKKEEKKSNGELDRTMHTGNRSSVRKELSIIQEARLKKSASELPHRKKAQEKIK